VQGAVHVQEVSSGTEELQFLAILSLQADQQLTLGQQLINPIQTVRDPGRTHGSALAAALQVLLVVGITRV
jgi:hypothetical protein